MASDLVSLQVQPAIDISAEEQLMIELINRARVNPSAEAARLGIGLNDNISAGQQISSAPKQPLAPVQALQNAAELHSKDMLDRDYFAHDSKAPSPNGSSPTERAKRAGYGEGIGENLSLWSLNGSSNSASVRGAHDSLIKSSGHRSNIMLESYRDIGVGIEVGEYSGEFFQGRSFQTMLTTEGFGFGDRHQGASITGVAFTDRVQDDDFYTIGEGLGGVNIEARNALGASFRTSTGASGGYSLRLPTGTYTVYASGSELSGSRIIGSVEVASRNVKIDMALDKFSGEYQIDVNQDGDINPLDVLVVINQLNRVSRVEGEYYANCDVNQNGVNEPVDVLIVINYLNRRVIQEAPAQEVRTQIAEGENDRMTNESPVTSYTDDFFSQLGTDDFRKQRKTCLRVSQS